MTKLLSGTCLLFFILLLIVEKHEIILNKHKKMALVFVQFIFV